MERYMTVEEFVEMYSTALLNSLKNDYPKVDEKYHIEDLAIHASSFSDALYYIAEASTSVASKNPRRGKHV